MRASLFLILLLPAVGHAQGQDGTPGERNRQIIAEILPGLYDNANQAYFDQRLKLPDDQRAGRTNLRVTSGEDTDELLFRFQRGDDEQEWRVGLTPAGDPELVAMRVDFDDERESCLVLWRRDAGQFTGNGDCGLRLQLSPDALWINWPGERPNRLMRAREFSCYVDIPGVAGGRDEPFDRYPIDSLHDQGGFQWVDTKDGRTLGFTLRHVRWPMNNEIGAFTRDSLVIYVLERTGEGIKTHSYGWTEPRAERIGLNLQWLLVNCYMVSNRDVRPYFD